MKRDEKGRIIVAENIPIIFHTELYIYEEEENCHWVTLDNGAKVCIGGDGVVKKGPDVFKGKNVKDIQTKEPTKLFKPSLGAGITHKKHGKGKIVGFVTNPSHPQYGKMKVKFSDGSEQFISKDDTDIEDIEPITFKPIKPKHR